MSDFEYCKYAYERGWANKEQLRIWVTKNKLSNLEYKEICNEEFK